MTWRTQTVACGGSRPSRGGIIEIIVKVFCKSLSNASDNVRFTPPDPHYFPSIFNPGIFIRSPFLFFGNNWRLRIFSIDIQILPAHPCRHWLRQIIREKDKTLSRAAIVVRRQRQYQIIFNKQEINRRFNQYNFFAQTIATWIQTFYRDTLPPSLFPI